MRRPIAIISLLIFVLISSVTFSDEKKKDDFWLPMAERVKIWDVVVSEQLSLSLPLPPNKLYTVSSNGLEATFEKDGSKWTIVGANAPIVNPTIYPKDWPVKGNDFEVLVIPEPITNYKVLPFTEKIENALKSDTLSITAAPDSYEPASFVIRSGDVDLKNVMIEVTDLNAEIEGKDGKKKTAIIPKENIDVRVVKCWYQAGVSLFDIKHKLLTPELLVHDNNIVKVDYDRQVNLLRNLEKIQDSEKLTPFDIPKKQNKQIWITAKIFSDTAKAGIYNGTIKIRAQNKASKNIKLIVNVLPFKLDAPYYTSSIYYRGKLDPSGKGSISSELKSELQLRRELENMYAHGVTNPTVYQYLNRELLEKVLKVRDEINMGKQPLYYLGFCTENHSTPEKLESLKNKVREVIDICKLSGIYEVYFYGVDEAQGEKLKSQRPAWQAVHGVGGKIFVAGDKETNFKLIGDIEDLLISSGQPSKIEAEKWHSVGHKIWGYGNPQAGEEQPETYRRNFGFLLWKNNYDGACPYAYQHGFGKNIWNDFDFKARPHNFTYPTIDGVIDTIEWEGYREGVSDIRYLTLLMRKIEQLRKSKSEKIKMLVEDAQKNLEKIDTQKADLDINRSEIIKYIIILLKR
jgi:hypothetical protein